MNIVINEGEPGGALSPFIVGGAVNILDPNEDFIYRVMIRQTAAAEYAAKGIGPQTLAGRSAFFNLAKEQYDERAGNANVVVEDFPAKDEDMTEPGYIYLRGKISEFRKAHASHAIVLRLLTRDEPRKTILAEIFPRQVGYGLDIDEAHDDERLYLIAMPSSVKGDLDIANDCIHGNFMKLASYY